MLTSSAQIFFQALLEAENAYALVENLVSSEAEENEWREFKEAGFIHPSPTELEAGERRRQNDTVKKYWSENLSAFANSGGGLLIWGIKTEKNKATSASLAGDAFSLKERLDEIRTDAADPPVLGVETLALCASGSRLGFVVCYIPSSPYSPHRATFGDGYYIRSGDSTRVMRTEILRRMFYPQLNHLLTPYLSLQVVDRDRRMGLISIDVVVSIENRGNASAQEAVIVATCDQSAEIYVSSNFWQKRLGQNHLACLQTIHPMEAIPMISNWTSSSYTTATAPQSATYTFTVMALNSPLLRMSVTFDLQDLKTARTRAVRKYAKLMY